MFLCTRVYGLTYPPAFHNASSASGPDLELQTTGESTPINQLLIMLLQTIIEAVTLRKKKPRPTFAGAPVDHQLEKKQSGVVMTLANQMPKQF